MKRFLGVLLATLPIFGNAVDQDYVETVAAEVEEFTSGKFTPRTQSAWAPQIESGGSASAAISAREFGQLLKKSLPGTYIMYRKLDSSQKNNVYKEYLKTGDLGQTRASVFKQASGRGRYSRPVIQNLPEDF